MRAGSREGREIINGDGMTFLKLFDRGWRPEGRS